MAISVEKAVEAGNLANLPVMVDFGYFEPAKPYPTLVTDKLRPGDISTHFYRWPAPLLVVGIFLQWDLPTDRNPLIRLHHEQSCAPPPR